LPDTNREAGDRKKMICLIIVAVEKHSESKKWKDRFEEIEVEFAKYFTDTRRNGFPVI